MDRLEVPLVGAGLQVERDDRGREQVMPGRVEPFCDEPLRLLPKIQKIEFVSGSTAGCIHGVAPRAGPAAARPRCRRRGRPASAARPRSCSAACHRSRRPSGRNRSVAVVRADVEALVVIDQRDLRHVADVAVALAPHLDAGVDVERDERSCRCRACRRGRGPSRPPRRVACCRPPRPSTWSTPVLPSIAITLPADST